MPYAIVRGARNTMRPVMRVPLRYVRRGFRGLGQACTSVDTSTGDCLSWSTEPGDQGVLGPTFNTSPVAPPSNTLLSPSSPLNASTDYGPIGSTQGCTQGPGGPYVVVDGAGNCGPASSVGSALGLNPQQLAALTSSGGGLNLTPAQIQQLSNAAINVTKAATGQPVSTVPVVASSSLFSSISPTTLMIGGVALLGCLVLVLKRR